MAILIAFAGCGRVGFDDMQADAGAVSSADGARRTYLFEDGFEGTLAPWNPLNNAVVDSGPPAPIEGAGVLRAQAAPATSARAEVMLPRSVGPGADLFVRGYFYLPSGFSITDLSLLEIVQPGTENLVVITSPELGLFTTIDNMGGASSYVPPRDVWLCIETRIRIADAPIGAVEISVDGVLQFQTSGIDTFAGGINKLTTGVTWAGAAQPDSVVYVDDVIADDVERIGCR